MVDASVVGVDKLELDAALVVDSMVAVVPAPVDIPTVVPVVPVAVEPV